MKDVKDVTRKKFKKEREDSGDGNLYIDSVLTWMT